MTAVTARFFVSEVNDRVFAPNNRMCDVVLRPDYKTGVNADWAAATPAGEFKLSVGPDLPAAQFFRDNVGKTLHITMDVAPTE